MLKLKTLPLDSSDLHSQIIQTAMSKCYFSSGKWKQ